MSMLRSAALTLLSLLHFLDTVQGHGYLRVPPGRSSIWREDRCSTPITAKNFQDNEMNCGGAWYHWGKDYADGKCGVCGDPYGQVQEHQPGGKYARRILSRCYETNSLVDVEVIITANHLGFVEFKLCPNNDFSQPVNQSCLDAHTLKIVNNPQPHYDDAHKDTRYRILAGQTTVFLTLELPKDLKCSQCVMQWRYKAGNSYGCVAQPGSPFRACATGLGEQETFYSCADIAIKDDCRLTRTILDTPFNCQRPQAVQGDVAVPGKVGQAGMMELILSAQRKNEAAQLQNKARVEKELRDREIALAREAVGNNNVAIVEQMINAMREDSSSNGAANTGDEEAFLKEARRLEQEAEELEKARMKEEARLTETLSGDGTQASDQNESDTGANDSQVTLTRAEKLAKRRARILKQKQARLAQQTQGQEASDISAQQERDRLAQQERDRLAQQERDRLAQQERDRLAQQERDRLAAQEAARVEREMLENERLNQGEASPVNEQSNGDAGQAESKAEDNTDIQPPPNPRAAKKAAQRRRRLKKKKANGNQNNQGNQNDDDQGNETQNGQNTQNQNSQSNQNQNDQGNLSAEEIIRRQEQARLEAEKQLKQQEAERLKAEEERKRMEEERLEMEKERLRREKEERMGNGGLENEEMSTQTEEGNLSAEEIIRLQEQARLKAEEQVKLEEQRRQKAEQDRIRNEKERLQREEEARVKDEAAARLEEQRAENERLRLENAAAQALLQSKLSKKNLRRAKKIALRKQQNFLIQQRVSLEKEEEKLRKQEEARVRAEEMRKQAEAARLEAEQTARLEQEANQSNVEGAGAQEDQAGNEVTLSCTGAGAWSGNQQMAEWCSTNCPDNCPDTHCQCT